MAPRVDEVVNVFYSSNEAGSFDRRVAFAKACAKLGSVLGVHINIIDWKRNIAGGVGARSGQDVIDRAVEGQYEIYFGCLGPGSGEGTIHEFEAAIASFMQADGPLEVLFGFDETPINPYLVSQEFSKVIEFRKDISTHAKFGRAMLYFAFSGPEEFEEKVLLNMTKAIEKAWSFVSGGIR